MDEAEGGVGAAPWRQLSVSGFIAGGRGRGSKRTEAIAALLALVGVDAETRLAVGRRHALDVAGAEGFDAVGAAAGGFFGVEGLSVVEQGRGGEAYGRGEKEEGMHRVWVVRSLWGLV